MKSTLKELKGAEQEILYEMAGALSATIKIQEIDKNQVNWEYLRDILRRFNEARERTRREINIMLKGTNDLEPTGKR